MQFWQKISLYLIFGFFIIYTPLCSLAQSTSVGITASTDKLSYKPGDKVTITGTIKNVNNENPVTILIRNPVQNVYAVGQVGIHGNIFVHDFVIGENSKPGVYTIEIRYGDQSASLQFTLTSGLIQNIQVESGIIRVRGDLLGLIKYKTATVSHEENSITIQMVSQTAMDPIPQEYDIPKEVIDAKQSLIIEADGLTLNCSETETSQSRILDCFIPNGTKELKLIGTSVIPEFGSLSIFVLILSVASLITYSRIRPR